MKWMFALLPFFCFSARAFTLSNSVAAAFDNDEVSVYVADHACDNIGISNAQLQSMVQEAMDTFWNRVPTSRLRLKSGGAVDVSTAFQTDQVCQTGTNCEPNPDLIVSGEKIIVSCNTSTENFASSNILAVTVPNNIEGRSIHGALVLINDRADNQFQDKSHAERVAILAHEIGHGIGLGHSKKAHNLMHFESSSKRKALGWDDVDGVTYLYPAAQPFKGGCGSIDVGGANGGGWPSIILGFLMCAGMVWFRRPCMRPETRA